MDTTGIPRELSSIALILDALPEGDRANAQDRIHRAHLSALDGAVVAAVRAAIHATQGAEAAGEWLRSSTPARFTDRDIYLAAQRHGAADELLEQGFTVPDDTPATVDARCARLADLWAEARDLAVDLANSDVHGAKTKVAASLDVSVDTVGRRFVRKK
ncbi:hypothetical protein QMK19_41005 [Streptomyces sp. H10-C2]|uniref:hypothetical protein n=1 Tax=unclassified Streptomyces TaxID=2593676 RepID=UPI0024B8E5F7|nr:MULTISPECIES: hypothetical protein [unclassified Streptomyces]MDJ0346808.1 hypothetical protein [Streptomyces sp. PH10-H1]MDJ0375778.1 hypothetical protein [Streptomyces sp. H10-C2]